MSNPNKGPDEGHREISTDDDWLETIKNTPVVMWTCPIPAHGGRRTDDAGKWLPTVEWRGEGAERMAHCLFDGCEMTSAVTDHYRDLVLEYVAKPRIEELLQKVWMLYLDACVCSMDYHTSCDCTAADAAGEILRDHFGDEWHEQCRVRWA